MQQTSDDPTHEQQRNKDSGQRQRHGENGETNLAGAIHGCLERPFTLLHVADDVLEHDDGVVHHESDGQGERHQGEIVEAVAQQVHHRKGPDDGHGQSEGRDDGGGNVSQENEDHHDDQSNGQQQGELHIVDRRTNRDGAVIKDIDLDRGRNMLLQSGQQLLDAVDDRDGVGSRLLLDRQHDGSNPVEPARGLVVQHAVGHAAEFVQANWRTIPIGHHHGPELQSIHPLAVGEDGVGVVLSIKRAGGKNGVSRLQRGGDVIDPDLA